MTDFDSPFVDFLEAKEKLHPFRIARRGHRMLRLFLGEWSVSGSLEEHGGVLPPRAVAGRATGTTMAHDVFVQLDTRLQAEEAKFGAVMTLGFNVHEDIYKLALVESQSPVMAVYDGTWDDGTQAFSFAAEYWSDWAERACHQAIQIQFTGPQRFVLAMGLAEKDIAAPHLLLTFQKEAH